MRSEIALAAALALAPSAAAAGSVLTGIDVLEETGFLELRGKRIGLCTNQTGKDRHGRSTVHILANAEGVQLKAIFAPEHGFDEMTESFVISSSTLRLPDGRAIPIYPSFGAKVAPTDVMLEGLDALVFDIQDVGTRFYTYAATMAMGMKMAASHHLPFYVLDRPNPINGEIVEGPIRDPDTQSFSSYFPIPVRHGLTVGEIARFYNEIEKTGAQLVVIPLKNWKRSQWFDQTSLPWTKPSPNMPDLDSATLYPGIACLEQTNLSVGRGTSIPFRWVGAPWLNPRKILKKLRKANIPGVEFSNETLTPAKNPYIYGEKKCRGIRLRIVDRDQARPLDIFVHLICAVRDAHPKQFELRWNGLHPLSFYLPTTHRLIGSEKFRQLYESGASAEEIIRYFHSSAEEFQRARAPFLLY